MSEDNEIQNFDEPLMDLLSKRKYWSCNIENLNPTDLIRDFLIDLGLIDDWIEYIKMRFEIEIAIKESEEKDRERRY